MNKNLDLVADELFGKIRTQFPKIKLRDEESQPTDEPDLARFFEFDFERNGVPLGSVSVNVSDDEGLIVTYSNDIVENQPNGVKKLWFNFLKELREFSRQKFMNFETRDVSKSNLDKRDYKFMAKQHGETNMSESKLWGNSKTSYQDLGETRLIIKHSQPVNTDIAAGRTMHIEAIYIENTGGERFRYPHRHLNGARAMAEHIAHGGNPYDDIGQYVVGLSEEMTSLRKFKGYVNRTPVVSEAMGSINTRVIERLEEIKKEVHGLQRTSYYEQFAESFTKSESREIPEDIVNDWIDRLTIRTFNEELKGVFPFIYKLVGEEINPIKTIGIEELLTAETMDAQQQFVNDIDEMQDYESYLNKLVGEGVDIFSNDNEAAQAAIDKLNELVSQEFPVGTDGSNAIESLSDVLDDDELNDIFKELADVNPEMDVRDILKDYIKIKDEENGTDILSQINFGPEGAEEAPIEEPAAEPVAPAAPAMAAPEAPAAPAMAAPEAPMPAPMAESDDKDIPFDGPYKKPGDNKDQFGNTVKNPARHAAKKGMKAAIEKAKKAGMKAEDTIRIFGEEVTLADAIQRAGLSLHEFFNQEYQESGDELVEFVKSMFDDETGRFPKGETGVMISVEKKFGEEALQKAKHVISELSTSAESSDIMKLAGLKKLDSMRSDNLSEAPPAPAAPAAKDALAPAPKAKDALAPAPKLSYMDQFRKAVGIPVGGTVAAPVAPAPAAQAIGTTAATGNAPAGTPGQRPNMTRDPRLLTNIDGGAGAIAGAQAGKVKTAPAGQAAQPKPAAPAQSTMAPGPATGSQAPTAQAAVDTAKLGLAAGSPALQPQQAAAPATGAAPVDPTAAVNPLSGKSPTTGAAPVDPATGSPADPTASVNPMSGKRVVGTNQPAAESTTFANDELSRIINLVHHR